MKLIFCKKCLDVISLRRHYRTCLCGRSSGNYKEDGLMATISGPCTPLGFLNGEFVSALRCQPWSGNGKTFTAFVIPQKCDTITVIEDKEK